MIQGNSNKVYLDYVKTQNSKVQNHTYFFYSAGSDPMDARVQSLSPISTALWPVAKHHTVGIV